MQLTSTFRDFYTWGDFVSFLAGAASNVFIFSFACLHEANLIYFVFFLRLMFCEEIKSSILVSFIKNNICVRH